MAEVVRLAALESVGIVRPYETCHLYSSVTVEFNTFEGTNRTLGGSR
jgi:hypothetical protein